MVPYVPCSEEEYFQRFIKEAPYVDGWHLNNETLETIDWLDRDLLDKSKAFFHKHRHLLAASSGIVAAFGVGVKSVSIPFMYSGTLSNNTNKTLRRTVKHITHFVEWFSRGTLDGYVYKDIQKIKKMHHLLATTIKPYEPPADETIPDIERTRSFRTALIKDIKEMGFENAFEKVNTYNPPVYLSQFDMVIIQLDFLAPLYDPGAHLIDNGDDEGVAAVVHHWAVVGRLLGIEDRFNLALHASKDLIYRMASNTIACSLTLDLSLARLLEAHLEGITNYFRLPLSSAGMFYVLAAQLIPDFKGENLFELMSLKEKILAYGSSFFMTALRRVNVLKTVTRNVGVSWYAKSSMMYHKLLKEDRMKLPIPT